MPEETQASNLVCCKCRIPLELKAANFHYLGHVFSAELPRCPGCGQVFLSEQLVTGKVNAVETDLEDK